ncbi:MAG: hypothetical protein KF736_07795 [Acidobacteria bacterium]|nr:hypothetical protein [Acidobacteriota bacterium]MCW5948977.1 hypothetical protein [Pyrinomonadaceae bacterium]
MTASFSIAAKLGSILILVALLIALVKQLIAFVGLVTTAVQILIAIAFVAVFALVAFLAYKAWQDRSKAA